MYKALLANILKYQHLSIVNLDMYLDQNSLGHLDLKI